MRQLIFAGILLIFTKTYAMSSHVSYEKSIDNVISKYKTEKEPQLISMFNKAHVSYPPKNMALLAFKKEQKIQLWAKDEQSTWKYVYTYPLTAYSGNLGPKLKEYDKQIPEGIYKLTMFNPYSTMHLSMMINYPNSFDKLQASKDGRRELGGDIFLHGKSYSVGCLAVGNKAIEQLFLLSRKVGLNHIQVIIAPNDLRVAKPATNKITQPRWVPELYKRIEHALSNFPVTNKRKV